MRERDGVKKMEGERRGQGMEEASSKLERASSARLSFSASLLLLPGAVLESELNQTSQID